MAVEHIVLMKLRDGVPEPQVNALCRECEAHFDKIPGIITASVGANFKPGPAGYTHGLVVRLENKQALENYIPHPEHVAAGKKLTSIFGDFLGFDYETNRP